MNQLILFNELRNEPLQTFVEREGRTLRIPEGINTTLCTHGIHRFPGKFIPNLPRFLIREFLADSPNRAICDPFCGSGTTLIEAALEGKDYVGIDIDPLAVMVSEAKVTALDEDEISSIEKHWEKFNYIKGNSELVPSVPNLQHWFSEKAILQLSAIKNHCLGLPARTRRFCLVVFSSIIRRVSNADDQTQKTYVSHTLPKTPPLPSELFPIFLQRALNGMGEYRFRLGRSISGSVVQEDAGRIADLGEADIITSPPYIDSVDYVYNQMLEYYWLLLELGMKDFEGYRAFRKIPMGFRKANGVKVDFVGRLNKRNRKRFEEAYKMIEGQSPKEAAHMLTFFEDFASHCDAAANAQGDQGRYICVIGESVIRGVTIPTVDLMENLFEFSEYEIEDRIKYEIRRHYMKFPRRSNSGKIKEDHILIMKR